MLLRLLVNVAPVNWPSDKNKLPVLTLSPPSTQ